MVKKIPLSNTFDFLQLFQYNQSIINETNAKLRNKMLHPIPQRAWESRTSDCPSKDEKTVRKEK